DMVDTAGTLCKAATALKANGAKKVVAYCTHPVLSGPAVERVNSSDLDALVAAIHKAQTLFGTRRQA
ncbi:MAG: hypothetical protein QMC09_17655, partial [Thauera sp.]